MGTQENFLVAGYVLTWVTFLIYGISLYVRLKGCHCEPREGRSNPNGASGLLRPSDSQ